MRSEKSKMLAGEMYTAQCPELATDAAHARSWLTRYNASLAAAPDELHMMLKELFAFVGEGAVVRPPFHCDYGFNITFGRGVFLNFNCIILDVVEVVIGDLTEIGPGVQILTPDHPRDQERRQAGLEFGRPSHFHINE